MGAKQQYEDLVVARKEIEEKTRVLVTLKLNRLAAVGQSVMQKKMGHGWNTEELSYLGEIGNFLKKPYSRVTDLTSTNIKFINGGFKSTLPKGGEFSISKEFLHLSDRDFAKYLRAKIYARKIYLKALEIRRSAEKIKDIELSITKNNTELKRLQNLKIEREKVMKALEDSRAKKSEGALSVRNKA